MKSLLILGLLGLVQTQTPVIYNDYSTEPKTKKGEAVSDRDLILNLPICDHQQKSDSPRTLSLSDYDGRTNGGNFFVTVIMTAYTGCDPARLDAPMYAKQVDELSSKYSNVVGLTSFKGGGDCSKWAELSGQTSGYPIYIQDDTRFLHYMFFSMHPQYAVLDKNMVVRHVFTSDELDSLTSYVDALVAEEDPNTCSVTAWSDFSECKASDGVCGVGSQSRSRTVVRTADNCPPLEEQKVCIVPCGEETCSYQMGKSATFINSDSTHLSNPWDLAFNPTKPGELWVANHDTDSFGVFVINSTKQITDSTMLRDRNPFHYMDQVSSLAWGKDGKICTVQGSLNTYDGYMVANNFQGPTLYDTDPKYLTIHDNKQAGCGFDGLYRNPDYEKECYLTHIDMLHESPNARGIAFDPEDDTPYGNVYWVFDGHNKELVRYDFEQPHGPGSMDHALAQVRRYTDVILTPSQGVPSHMHLDHASRHLYISDSGTNRILVVNVDSGQYLEDARVKYPIFSSQLPSFQYSIWGCTEYHVFTADIDLPSGIAVTDAQVFVAEFRTGNIVAFNKQTGTRMATFPGTNLQNGLSSIVVAPDMSAIFFSHTTNQLGFIPLAAVSSGSSFRTTCPRHNKVFTPGISARTLSQTPLQTCSVEATRSQELPPVIDHDAGYMNMDAITDGYADLECSEMNLDALLLAGYFCHRCLPGPRCQNGGVCVNQRYQGFSCQCNTDPTSDTYFYGDTCQHSVPKQSKNLPCVDAKVDGRDWHDSGGVEYTCKNHYERSPNACAVDATIYEWGGMTASQACCACGGGEVGGKSKSQMCSDKVRVFCSENNLSQCSALEDALCM